jgi:hypothetical protein
LRERGRKAGHQEREGTIIRLSGSRVVASEESIILQGLSVPFTLTIYIQCLLDLLIHRVPPGSPP